MKLFKRIKAFNRKIFFNPKWRCLSCGREIFDGDFCEDCKKSLPYVSGTYCNHCGRETKVAEEYCLTCKNFLVSLDKGRSVFRYEKPIDTLIQKAKYYNEKYLIEYFGQELAGLYYKSYFNSDYLCFVPMSKQRKKKRKYNQGKLLAEELSRRINVPVFYGIEKSKETPRQAKLSKAERLKNLQGSFSVRDKKMIKDKNILIVDDVSTTGATAEVLAKKLKESGVKTVNLITVASVSRK